MITNLNSIVPKEVAHRINSNIDFGSKSISDCWLWSGCLFSAGYGCVTVGGKNRGAHRIAWEMHNGMKIPEGLLIRHGCDNPACCNPFHLMVGTVQDNSDDMVLRNRQAQCQNHGRAKITDQQALEIINSNKSYRTLSDLYGLSKTTIAKIKTGQNWQGLGAENVVPPKARCKLNVESARKVYLAKGLQQEIAERFGITQKQVSYIKSGRAWGKATADLRGK